MDYSKVTLFSKISNTIFLITSIFCLFFLWCNFYIKNIKVSLISSLVVIICFSIIYFPIYSYQKQKSNKKITTNKILNNLKSFLILSKDAECFKLLSKIINMSDYNIISNNHIHNENHDIFFLFCKDEYVNYELNSIFKNRHTNNIIIYCINESAINFDITIENINIEYVNINKIYNILQEKNIEIDYNYIIRKKPKLHIFNILCIVLNKARSKNYLMFGLLLLFTSLFTPYSIYYIIMSTILILLSIFSRFNTIFNKKVLDRYI